MTHLIDKSTLVTEIKKRIKETESMLPMNLLKILKTI
jgi:hypothetical protein